MNKLGSKKYNQSWYVPVNPEKYVGGNITKIRCMSSWERDVCKFLDTNPRILRWGSECISIPYFKRSTGRNHKYFIDFYVKYVNRHKEIVEELWEVKPAAQLKAPRNTKRKKETTYLYERTMWETNQDKWKAAQFLCNKKGIKFRILTEKDIFI